MEHVLDWGINIILWFQQFSPALDAPFRFFTFLGEEPSILLLLPFIYWCFDRELGARLTVFFLCCDYTNKTAKTLLAQPRPFEYAPQQVHPLSPASGYGFPSGHSQDAVAIWGYLATQLRRTWFWVVALTLILLIALSRIYLGVHFPTDVLGGLLFGVLLLLAYLWLEPKVEPWLRASGLAWQLGVALVVPVLMMVAVPAPEPVTPAATLLGMGVGFVLERRWVRFESGGVWWKRLVRFLLGAVVLAGLWLGLKTIFGDAEPALLLRAIRYALVGLWGSFGAPWFFARLRLVETSA